MPPTASPSAACDHGYVYNFWQDANNPKGLWRRTTIADYQNPTPHWEVLLDVDALAKAESENWVFKGVKLFAGRDALPDQPVARRRRCRGGARIRSEDDETGDRWLQPARSQGRHATYLDDDTVLFATASKALDHIGLCPHRQTMEARHNSRRSAKTIYEGKPEDVLVAPPTFHTKDGNFALVVRAVSFFETEYFCDRRRTGPQSSTCHCRPIVKGMIDGALIATLREDYTRTVRTSQGRAGGVSKMALPAAADLRARSAPEHRRRGHQAVTRIYAAITDNVIGSVHVFAHDGYRLDRQGLALPGQGAAESFRSTISAAGAVQFRELSDAAHALFR